MESSLSRIKVFSALLALREGNPPVTGVFPSQRSATRSFDVFFGLHLNKRFSIYTSLGHHCNETLVKIINSFWPLVAPHGATDRGNHWFIWYISTYHWAISWTNAEILLIGPEGASSSDNQWRCRATQMTIIFSWWRHQIETSYALLALCEVNSPVTGEFSSQRPVTRSFWRFAPNKWLSKPSRRRWFETPWRSLWRHCNVLL